MIVVVVRTNDYILKDFTKVYNIYYFDLNALQVFCITIYNHLGSGPGRIRKIVNHQTGTEPVQKSKPWNQLHILQFLTVWNKILKFKVLSERTE